ncbi:MAG: Holliday junction DNA helicase RuvA [Alphaproteobacteria bacterium]|jgi:Holliday junction DNA helicase RuvA
MIYFLKGIVEEMGEKSLAIDVNGVGYLAFCSSKTLASLTVGEVTKLHIHSHVREQEFTLFGFGSTEERECFQLLTSVNGVGPKVGLAILSALSANDIVTAVTNSDGKMMARASGVGPKLGDRIVLELSGKIGSISMVPQATEGTIHPQATGVNAEVVSALSNLGYRPAQAEKAVFNALENVDGDVTFDNLFKASLQEMR